MTSRSQKYPSVNEILYPRRPTTDTPRPDTRQAVFEKHAAGYTPTVNTEAPSATPSFVEGIKNTTVGVSNSVPPIAMLTTVDSISSYKKKYKALHKAEQRAAKAKKRLDNTALNDPNYKDTLRFYQEVLTHASRSRRLFEDTYPTMAAPLLYPIGAGKKADRIFCNALMEAHLQKSIADIPAPGCVSKNGITTDTLSSSDTLLAVQLFADQCASYCIQTIDGETVIADRHLETPNLLTERALLIALHVLTTHLLTRGVEATRSDNDALRDTVFKLCWLLLNKP